MLVLKKINKKYANKTIIKNFSYCFEENQIYIILAESGKGKTTLLNIIAQVDKSYSGQIFYDGLEIINQTYFNLKNISYIHQDYNLFEEMTVLENINLLNNDYDKKELNDYAKRLKIDTFLNKKVKFLSGGEKQRVSILRAILKKGKIILADEPTSSLDEQMAKEVIKIFTELKKNKIIIIVTHNQKIFKNLPVKTLNLNENNQINTIFIQKNNLKKDSFKLNLKKILKIYKNNKYFSYLTNLVLFFGLYITGLSFLINNVLDQIIIQQFSSINMENIVTLKADYPISSKQITIDLDINYEIYDNYIKSDYPELIMEYLRNKPEYANYIFTIENNRVYYEFSNVQRIMYKDFLTFINENKKTIKDYFISDNEKVVIDYYKGFIFLPGINSLKTKEKEYKIDNSMLRFCFNNKKEEIAISSKLAQKLNININQMINLFINQKWIEIKINDIYEDSLFETIYASSSFLNYFFDLSNINIYNIVCFTNTNQIKELNNLKINKNLTSVNDYDFIKDISKLLLMYGIVIMCFSLLIISLNFDIYFLKNKKNILILQRLGVLKESQRFILLYRPFINLLKILFLLIINLLITFMIIKYIFEKNLITSYKLYFPYNHTFLFMMVIFTIYTIYFFQKSKNIIKK